MSFFHCSLWNQLHLSQIWAFALLRSHLETHTLRPFLESFLSQDFCWLESECSAKRSKLDVLIFCWCAHFYCFESNCTTWTQEDRKKINMFIVVWMSRWEDRFLWLPYTAWSRWWRHTTALAKQSAFYCNIGCLCATLKMLEKSFGVWLPSVEQPLIKPLNLSFESCLNWRIQPEEIWLLLPTS